MNIWAYKKIWNYTICTNSGELEDIILNKINRTRKTRTWLLICEILRNKEKKTEARNSIGVKLPALKKACPSLITGTTCGPPEQVALATPMYNWNTHTHLHHTHTPQSEREHENLRYLTLITELWLQKGEVRGWLKWRLFIEMW